jgi:hypothetical protein
MDTNYAWAAGFFDGEGCVSVVLYRERFMMRLYVGNTDVRPLYIFKGLFGGSIGARGAKIPNAKPAYYWQATSQQALTALREMLPYLVVKRGQAELALQFGELIRPRGGNVPLTEEEVNQRVIIMAELGRLNKRGSA